MNNFGMLNDHLGNNFTFNHKNTSWIGCDENNSDAEEICACHQISLSDSCSHGGGVMLQHRQSVQGPENANKDSRLLEHDYNSATITGRGAGSGSGSGLESNSRIRVTYEFTSTPRSSQVNFASLVHGITWCCLAYKSQRHKTYMHSWIAQRYRSDQTNGT